METLTSIFRMRVSTAIPDPLGVSAERRLARLLKYLLRGCLLRCVSIEELKDKGQVAGPTKAAQLEECKDEH